MTDTVTKLMEMVDAYANHCRGWLTINPTHRQALEAELEKVCDEIETLRNGMFNIANQSTEPAIKEFAQSYLEAQK